MNQLNQLRRDLQRRIREDVVMISGVAESCIGEIIGGVQRVQRLLRRQQ